MKKACKYIWDNLELVFMQICFWLLLICICVNIVLRLFLNHPLFFAEELSRIFFVWMCFSGFGYVTKNKTHIRITVLTEKLPPLANRVLEMCISLLELGVFTWIFINGIQYLNYVSIRRSSALQIPMQYLVFIIPLTAAIMLIRIVANMVQDVRAMHHKEVLQ